MADPAGIQCPHCGVKLNDVTQTGKSEGAILRRRKCFNGHVFVTEEIVGGDDKFRAWYAAMRRESRQRAT